MTEATNMKTPGQMDKFPLLIDGCWEAGEGTPFSLLNKYTLQPVADIATPSDAQLARAIEAAAGAFITGAPTPYERGTILQTASRLVAEQRAEFVRIMQMEAGFTASDANGEIGRCIETLRLSAEEARRLAGDVIPMEGAPNQSGRLAFTLRVPLGVVAAITPFNAPLNTVAHKIAPAFAAGNSVILKPSSNTPLTALKLCEVLVEAGMPTGFLSLVQGGARVAEALLADQRIRFFAFTGSTEVGRSIQQAAGLRRTQMELGSIAFTLLCEDADLEKALPKIGSAGYRKAGQVCTSVQILLVQRTIFSEVQDRLAKIVASLAYGDPANPDTVVGPLISEKEAIRIENWIEEAIAGGARKLAGGTREGAVITPTLLTGIDPAMKVGGCEIFGPVVCLEPFDTLEEAIDRVNSTPFGLASGIFTQRIDNAFKSALKLEVGGVHINETSSSRVDMMPYGGSKDSGFGREGPRYAVHEMTEERVITITLG
ncbi:aldehyde dehydrogenase family protein [Roseibium aggregatum]|uniref:Aldehyde dehydrogenase family protein n=1 Tax=Roseibium aggregatum TaxID=187304 RepID=A0A939EFH3_9HYPH|nr:aldehyde dehydrogenase family protein [Roseibium aggregatum]MBN9671527.1 aldehyde dehydrogenase family protein [Roseibium aggregatum]